MIDRLSVKNFKCFANMEMECYPFMVLCGVNSCGKSSVIQAILMAEEVRRSAGTIDLMNMVNGSALYSFDEILYDDAEDEEIEIMLSVKDSAIRFSFSSEENDNNISCELSGDRSLLESGLGNLWYLGSDRMISQYQRRGNAKTITLGGENEYLGFLLEKGRSGKLPVDKRRNLKDVENTLLMTQVNEWLDYILPGNQVMAATQGNDNFVSIRFGREYKFHKTNVGYGVSFVLPILVSGLLAQAGDLVVVENPELHLHPKAQSDLMFFLARMVDCGVQVIIETHSDHIVNGVRKAVINDQCNLSAGQAVIYFFDEERHAHMIKINSNAELSEWPKDFMEQEEIDLHYIRRMRLMHGNNFTDEHTDTV